MRPHLKMPEQAPAKVDLELLRCPVTHRALRSGPDSSVLVAPPQTYPLLQEGPDAFVNFLGAGDLSPDTQAQKHVYESEGSRYATQLREDRGLVSRMVDDFVRGRVKNKDEVLRRVMKAQRVDPSSLAVEIGCNDGRFIDVFSALHGCRGIGVDLSERAIRRALRARPPGLKTEFHVAEGARLPLAAGTVRTVLSFDVFEHLGHSGVRAVMRECARVLEPGGSLIAYVVSRKDQYTLHETFRTISGGAVGVDQGEGHVYENFLLPDEFRAAAQEYGLGRPPTLAVFVQLNLQQREMIKCRRPAGGNTPAGPKTTLLNQISIV
jgi:cyclopropane fatty-acyl-phospholipid synthase-like methyltransferase